MTVCANIKRTVFVVAVLGTALFIPLIARLMDEPFFIDIAARIMIWSIAAVSLNLILGYGGMVSFGHAVYLGIAGYTVGICAYYGVESAWLQWPLALALCALVALVFGAISLRTRGVYFIMITLALTQMIYFLAVSIDEYGSDDGLVIYTRSIVTEGWYDLDKPLHLYYTIFAVLIACLYFTHRLVESRFGMVIRGAQANEARMEAMGFSTLRYRLACFVIAGVMCGLAGILNANVEKFISPDVMDWKHSGELIFMTVLGGMGSVFGPVAGALVFWLLAEVLSRYTEHWHLIFGPFLILVVLFARRGIDGLLDKRHV